MIAQNLVEDNRLQKLQKVVDKVGIWKGDRRRTHSFLLSPSVLELTWRQRQEL